MLLKIPTKTFRALSCCSALHLFCSDLKENHTIKEPQGICSSTTCSRQEELWDWVRMLRALSSLVFKISKNGGCTKSLGTWFTKGRSWLHLLDNFSMGTLELLLGSNYWPQFTAICRFHVCTTTLPSFINRDAKHIR